MSLCETREQRWRACRFRVYGEEMVSGFAFCNLWQARFVARSCTSPRRRQCRAGITQFHGYFSREAWRWQQIEAGRRGYPHTDWDRCSNPLSNVRASDWLKEID